MAQQAAGYYVYTLAYPANTPLANTVFYVGKGSGKRIAEHEKEARSSCMCKKCEVIRHIWGVGGQVKREIIFETGDEAEALTFEQRSISFTYAGSYLINTHHNPLANVPSMEVTFSYNKLEEGDMGAAVAGMDIDKIFRQVDERDIADFLGGASLGDPKKDRELYDLIWDAAKDVPGVNYQ